MNTNAKRLPIGNRSLKKMSILDAVVAGFLSGMIDGCTKKRRKRNCPYSYQYKHKPKRF